MKVKTIIISSISLFIIIGGIYAKNLINYYVDITFCQTLLVSNMGEVSQLLDRYMLEGYVPANLQELGLSSNNALKDPFTGEYLLYMPENYGKTNLLPLVVQSDYYRTQLWPFGEYKKYAIMNKPGMIHPIYKKNYEQ